MLRITPYKTLLLFFVFLSAIGGKAQGILATYIKEAPPSTHFIYINLNQPDYIIDDISYKGRTTGINNDFISYQDNIKNSLNNLTAKQKEFIARINYYRSYYEKPPLEFKECTYYNPSFSSVDHIIQGFYKRSDFIMPEAFRFYSTQINDTTLNHFDLTLQLSRPLYEFMEQFYFKKTAITNKEYREFVHWVKDSIIHTILSDNDPSQVLAQEAHGNDYHPPIIYWKAKIDMQDSNVMKALIEAGLYKAAQERFYDRNEIDTRRLNYQYNISDAKGDIINKTVNIYPDTLAWVNDFPYSFMEPLTNMYFWHPAYNDYPVVGISKLQAMAFLNWKTIQEQKKLNKEGKGQWMVSYELPTEYEWEMVETANRIDGNPDLYPNNYSTISDYTDITDLSFKLKQDTIPFSFHDSRDTLNTKLHHPDKEEWSYTKLARHNILISNTSLGLSSRFPSHNSYGYNPPVFKADFQKNIKKVKSDPLYVCYYDCNGISFMGTNVSEWMQETYKDNWKPVYEYRHKLLEELGGKDSKLMLANEDYYHAMNDTGSSSGSASLVRGANWYDYRTGCKEGKNTEGMNAKAFVNPDSDYSTLGFRYVIKIHRKDEKQLVDSIQNNLFKTSTLK